MEILYKCPNRPSPTSLYKKHIAKSLNKSAPLPLSALQINTPLLSLSRYWVLTDALYIHPDFLILLIINESFSFWPERLLDERFWNADSLYEHHVMKWALTKQNKKNQKTAGLMNLRANSSTVNWIHVSHYSCLIKMFPKRRQDTGDRQGETEDSGELRTS